MVNMYYVSIVFPFISLLSLTYYKYQIRLLTLLTIHYFLTVIERTIYKHIVRILFLFFSPYCSFRTILYSACFTLLLGSIKLHKDFLILILFIYLLGIKTLVICTFLIHIVVILNMHLSCMYLYIDSINKHNYIFYIVIMFFDLVIVNIFVYLVKKLLMNIAVIPQYF